MTGSCLVLSLEIIFYVHPGSAKFESLLYRKIYDYAYDYDNDWFIVTTNKIYQKQYLEY